MTGFHFVKTFRTQTAEEIEQIHATYHQFESTFKELALYWAEDPTRDPEEFFNIVKQFCTEFSNIHKQLEDERLEKEKEMKRALAKKIRVRSHRDDQN